MATRLTYVRHGESDGNRSGKFFGQAETPLTSRGITQARALADRLADERFDAAYSSDLSRAADTARHLLEGRGPEAVLDPRLREVHYGEWEAMDGRAVVGKSRDAWDAFLRGDAPAPGGEDITALRWRMAAAAREYADRHPGGSVLVVSHGSAIAALLAEVLGVPTASTWSFVLHNTGVTRLGVGAQGRFTLLGFNDIAHLDAVEEKQGSRWRGWWHR